MGSTPTITVRFQQIKRGEIMNSNRWKNHCLNCGKELKDTPVGVKPEYPFCDYMCERSEKFGGLPEKPSNEKRNRQRSHKRERIRKKLGLHK